MPLFFLCSGGYLEWPESIAALCGACEHQNLKIIVYTGKTNNTLFSQSCKFFIYKSLKVIKSIHTVEFFASQTSLRGALRHSE